MSDENIVNDILGTGFCFPMKVDGHGGIAMTRQEKDIDESIRIILSTARGERHMRPMFGCRIHELIFAPNNATTWGLMQQYVEEALGWWEPRIEVINIDVNADPTDTSHLLVDILYKVKATSDKRSLVYPFYLSG
ncbi:MAG: GPW/gp25 family protein [Chloroflexota bacterium]|nr:GPW/gp25 family protein [Chloroflexota bacterium]